MAFKVVNKARQAIPVSVVQGGKEIQVLLLSAGPDSSTVSEKETKVIANLKERGLIATREIKAEQPKQEQHEPKQEKKGNKK